MKKSRRKIELVKTILIPVLIVSALFLGWRTDLFNTFFTSIPFFSSTAHFFAGLGGKAQPAAQPGGSAAILQEAARPMGIVVTGDDGGHYGACFDLSALDDVYEGTSSIFGEAFGSAGAPESVTEREWRAALASPGFYYEYMAPVSLSVLSAWFGGEIESAYGDYDTGRICVTFQGDSGFLYFEDEDTGSFYRMGTLSLGDKSLIYDAYKGNGTQFVFETALTGSAGDPYTLLFPDVDHYTAQSQNPVSGEAIDAVLSAFGGGEQAGTSYQESDGSVTYVQNGFTLRVAADGAMTYKSTGGGGPSNGTLSLGEIIEKARALVADTIGQYCGDARVYFDLTSSDGQGGNIVTFRYCIAGGVVSLGGNSGWAASALVQDGQITEMTLNFRAFTLTADRIHMLPEKQAYAAAGGGVELYYVDSGGGLFTPEWVAGKPIALLTGAPLGGAST